MQEESLGSICDKILDGTSGDGARAVILAARLRSQTVNLKTFNPDSAPRRVVERDETVIVTR